MDIKEHIRKLRTRLLHLNQQYIDGMRDGLKISDLQDVNSEINALVELIQSLEKGLSDESDKNDTWV